MPVLSSKGPIRGDAPDKYIVLIGVVVFVFLATFGGQLAIDALIALAMIFAGDFLEKRFDVDSEDHDESDDEEEDVRIGKWVAATFAVFLALNVLVPSIPPSVQSAISSAVNGVQLSSVTISPLSSTAFLSRAFGALIAIAEERFFRKSLGNIFITRSDPVAGSLADGGVFALAHWAIYGDSFTDIVVVFGSGIFMCYADYRTRRASTSEISHILNNVLV